ncbi:MAG: hypothetical protein K2X39_09000 [Silvanigrellaceae bacterium]|nr:hypothetical protein [Silvanigrellaceae bacterium]
MSVDPTKLEEKFREYRKACKLGVGKRWPEEFKELVRQAHEQGVTARRLSLLCQVHSEVIRKWLLRDRFGKLRFQELTVLKESNLRKNKFPSMKVLLPNWIKIEVSLEYFTTEAIHKLCSVPFSRVNKL